MLSKLSIGIVRVCKSRCIWGMVKEENSSMRSGMDTWAIVGSSENVGPYICSKKNVHRPSKSSDLLMGTKILFVDLDRFNYYQCQ